LFQQYNDRNAAINPNSQAAKLSVIEKYLQDPDGYNAVYGSGSAAATPAAVAQAPAPPVVQPKGR